MIFDRLPTVSVGFRVTRLDAVARLEEKERQSDRERERQRQRDRDRGERESILTIILDCFLTAQVHLKTFVPMLCFIGSRS